MISLSHTVTVTTEIQKSKFICKIIPISKLEEIEDELEKIKKEYKGATHYCYAYLFDQVKRFSDDGEPSGTAGMPILNVLESQELNHVLAIVVRNFGGIKLGAGGLVRAYTNSVVKTLEQSVKINLILGNIIALTFPYDQEKRMQALFYPYPAITKNYEEEITYHLFLPHSYLSTLPYPYRIIEENVLGEEKKA